MLLTGPITHFHYDSEVIDNLVEMAKLINFYDFGGFACRKQRKICQT